MSEKPRIGSLVKYADVLRHPLPWVGVVVPLDNPYYVQSVHTSVGVKWIAYPAVVEEWAHELEVVSEGR